MNEDLNSGLIIDLSHTLHIDMPFYPGSCKPEFIVAAEILTEGYSEILLKIPTHTGTHIDCPSHLIEGGFTTVDAAPERFVGRGMLINCVECCKNGVIPGSFIRGFEGEIKKSDFVLLYSGWSRYWGSDYYYENFPVLDNEACTIIGSSIKKGIGFDMPSADPVGSVDLPLHKELLDKGIILIENLANLHLLENKEFFFICLPLKINNGDGSPVRAIAITA